MSFFEQKKKWLTHFGLKSTELTIKLDDYVGNEHLKEKGKWLYRIGGCTSPFTIR